MKWTHRTRISRDGDELAKWNALGVSKWSTNHDGDVLAAYHGRDAVETVIQALKGIVEIRPGTCGRSRMCAPTSSSASPAASGWRSCGRR